MYLFLSVHIENTILNGRPFQKNKDAIIESLRILIPSLPQSGLHSYWVGYATDESVWIKMIRNLFFKTYACYANRKSYPHTYSRETPNPSNSSAFKIPHNTSQSPLPTTPATPHALRN